MTVAALYVDPVAGPYPGLIGPEHCWGIERDAKTYSGPGPVIAHPPCGPWGRFGYRCTRQDPDAGIKAVLQVQRFGGVLEHPAHSRLWKACRLPVPGQRSLFAPGFTIEFNQVRFGHPCVKPTWLYVAGLQCLPPLPPVGPTATHQITTSRARFSGGKWIKARSPSKLPLLPTSQRHLTPPAFAAWLLAAISA